MVTLSHAIFSAWDLQGFETAIVSNLEPLASALWSAVDETWQSSDIVSPCFWMTGFQANLWLRWSREGSLIMWFVLWRISVCFNCFNFLFGNHNSIRSTRKTQELVMFPWAHVWAGIVGRSFFQIPGRRSRRFRTLDSACTDHSFSHNGKTGYVRRVVWIVEKDVLSNVGDAFVQWVSS